MANSQMIHHTIWESEWMTKHKKLEDEYRSLKEKQGLMSEQVVGKHAKKEMVLEHKAKGTLTRMGMIEAQMYEKEDAIEQEYIRGVKIIKDKFERAEDECEEYMRICREKRDKAIREAEQDYQQDIKSITRKKEKAEEKYESALSFYNSQKETCMNKAKREYDGKKALLEAKGEAIDGERAFALKTAAEITIEKQIQDVLRLMQSSIATLKMGRGQLTGNPKFNMSIPKLPEPIITHAKPVKKVEVEVEVEVEESDDDKPTFEMDGSAMDADEAELLLLRQGDEDYQQYLQEKKNKQEQPNRKTVYGLVGPGVGAIKEPVAVPWEKPKFIFEDCIDSKK